LADFRANCKPLKAIMKVLEQWVGLKIHEDTFESTHLLRARTGGARSDLISPPRLQPGGIKTGINKEPFLTVFATGGSREKPLETVQENHL
jgi:hypothetical protein